ncbi:topless-related protein 1-like [Arachis ipaensis]|uniref:topless-related protein 1-like n=1 Tax=Arachis ipaensis TaxID=130454 RepID=UPI000A2AF16D|nr:topless-related protein 1-like [Arachis ipaensis]XP_025654224.1 topless-related protein 1 [Arachis hypogaea]
MPTPLAGWMSNPTIVAHAAVSGGATIGLGTAIGLGAPSIHAALKDPRTPPTNPSVDYPSGDSNNVSKRTRPMGMSDEVNLPINVLSATFLGHGHGQAFNAPYDLPKTIMRTLNQDSSPMSMDFHPVQQTILLGCSCQRSRCFCQPCDLESRWCFIRSCLRKVHCSDILLSWWR